MGIGIAYCVARSWPTTLLEPVALRAVNAVRGREPYLLLKRPQLSFPGELELANCLNCYVSDALHEYVLGFAVRCFL